MARDPDPVNRCPRCGGEVERDEVDNGVGMEAVGPWGCPDCHWVELRPEIDDDPDWPRTKEGE